MEDYRLKPERHPEAVRRLTGQPRPSTVAASSEYFSLYWPMVLPSFQLIAGAWADFLAKDFWDRFTACDSSHRGLPVDALRLRGISGACGQNGVVAHRGPAIPEPVVMHICAQVIERVGAIVFEQIAEDFSSPGLAIKLNCRDWGFESGTEPEEVVADLGTNLPARDD
jgi:hypothetical protein